MGSLVTGIILGIISGFISLDDKWKKRSNKDYNQKHNRKALFSFIIVCIGSYLTFTGGYSALRNKEQSQQAAKQKEKENKALSDSLFKINQRLYQLNEENKALLQVQLDRSHSIVRQGQVLIDSLNRGLSIQRYTNKTSNEVLSKSNLMYARQERDSISRLIDQQMSLLAAYNEINAACAGMYNDLSYGRYDLFKPTPSIDTIALRKELGRIVKEVLRLLGRERSNKFLLQHKRLQEEWKRTETYFSSLSNKIDGYSKKDHRMWEIVLDYTTYFGAFNMNFKFVYAEAAGQPYGENLR